MLSSKLEVSSGLEEGPHTVQQGLKISGLKCFTTPVNMTLPNHQNLKNACNALP